MPPRWLGGSPRAPTSDVAPNVQHVPKTLLAPLTQVQVALVEFPRRGFGVTASVCPVAPIRTPGPVFVDAPLSSFSRSREKARYGASGVYTHKSDPW